MSLLDKASLVQIPSGYGDGKLYSVIPEPSLSELVINGDFATNSDWTIGGAGGSISGGQLTLALGGSAYQISGNITANTQVEVTFEGSGVVNYRFDVAGSAPTTAVTLPYTATVNTGSGNMGIQLINLSGAVTLDNVSIKSSTNGDFDFSRSSSATRVNSEGLIEVASVLGSELVVNGDFSEGSANWILSGSNLSIANGKGISTGSNFGAQFKQTILQTNKTYKLTFDIVDYTSGEIGLTANYYGQANIFNSVGTHTAIFTSLNQTELRIYSQNFIGSIDNVSVKEVFENDVPRLDYSDGSCASLLLEGQSTNLLTYSNDFTQWTIQSGVTATHNTTETLSPDGTNNATKFVGNGTSGVLKSAPVTGVVARSIYLKSVSGTVNVILKDPIFTVTQKSLSVTTEWQRFDLIEDNTHSSTQGLWVDDIPSSGIYMWGGQLESGDYSTSYIPTSGSTVTRTADVCNNAGTSGTFSDSEGVLFFEAKTTYDSSLSRRVSISDGSISNRVSLEFDESVENTIKGFINSTVLIYAADNLSTYNKIALQYKSGEHKLWINGNEVKTSTSANIPSGLDRLSFDGGDGNNDFYGKTKQLMVFDEALSDAELSDLTGQVNTSFAQLANFYNYTIL